ncbi:GNAT family N-acetyltransferase [Actinomadura craniellae]|uniref:GNAT family N-acetyltransferase n=1 Tax=Actinomadura craniellae TaxID=2231787 RepID=A0A365H2W2_9ACTN|nr:GNAT family N-acetyltransferase [Actinomadura craniellae]
MEVSPASYYDPAVVALCAEQQTELEERYAGTDEAPQGIDPEATFLVARIGREPVGCAGLLPLGPRMAEVTRMYVRPIHRGQGISRLLLARVEDLAREREVRRLRLETGDLQPESIGLYQSAGYTRVPAYGRYVGSPLSLCFEKHLWPVRS